MCEPYQVCANFPPIDEYRMKNLANEIEEKEIRQAIFSMSPLKAPRVDGLHAIFYQTQWHIVGESFCKVINYAFRSQRIPVEKIELCWSLSLKWRTSLSLRCTVL